MMFFKKRKKIVLHAFVEETNANIAQMAPIVPVKENPSVWWKNLSPSSKFNFDNMSVNITAKSCIGIHNMVSTGFFLPIWSDLAIDVWPEKSKMFAVFSDTHTPIMAHSNDQIQGFCGDHSILKISSPWRLKCDEHINFLCCDPIYSKEKPKPFITFPGIVDFKYQSSTNILFGFENFNETKHIFRVGDPLYQIIPLTEKEVELKVEVLSTRDFSLVNPPLGNFFSHRYFRHKKVIQNLEEQKGKCPFGFGK